MTNKAKVEIEKPVFCVVEQTKVTSKDRYRVVIFKNVKAKAITIEKVDYVLVESETPGINAHAFRVFCAKGNEQHAIEHGIKSKAQMQAQEQERQRNWKANQAQREEEYKQARKARYEERQQGIKQARPILREMAIRKRMMDEVESGQQALPKNLRSVI
jgi:hypothetical protein